MSSQKKLVQYVLCDASAGWAEMLRETADAFSELIENNELDHKEALVLAILYTLGGCQVYMPNPETMMYKKRCINSRVSTFRRKIEKTASSKQLPLLKNPTV